MVDVMVDFVVELMVDFVVELMVDFVVDLMVDRMVDSVVDLVVVYTILAVMNQRQKIHVFGAFEYFLVVQHSLQGHQKLHQNEFY